VQLTLPLTGEDLMGDVYITRPFQLFDIDVLAWLVQRWRETEMRDDGYVGFSLREMGTDFFGVTPSGAHRQMLRASLVRLRTETVTIVGWDAIRKQRNQQVCSLENLISILQWRPQMNGPARSWDPAALGALRGHTFEAALAPWMVAQLQAGNVTYLDWRILRALKGSAKRLWAYLMAQKFERVGGVGCAETTVVLNDRTYMALGLHEARPDARRRRLRHAGQDIVEADRSFAEVRVEREPYNRRQWKIVALRLSAEAQKIRASGVDPRRPLGA
jgi:hypothetical protein